MLLLLAALPTLFWDGAADTAPALRQAGITKIQVPASRLAAWKGVPEFSAEASDLLKSMKLLAPTVNYRMNEASATNKPWLVHNGWRFLRRPQGLFYYDVTGEQAAMAAAEAFSYGIGATIKTDAAGLNPLGAMLAFLRTLPEVSLPAVADIGYIDDGSAASGEVMNLMVRGNLQFRLVSTPDRQLKVNVKLGTKEYPMEDAKNPGTVAHLVRANLGDEKRSLRIYGSDVVVGRLTAANGKARLHLLNYAGANRKVDGIRVRVAGEYAKHELRVAGIAGVELQDYSVDAGATEFTLPELRTYAVIDLSR
jgi:hypothetical protein